MASKQRKSFQHFVELMEMLNNNLTLTFDHDLWPWLSTPVTIVMIHKHENNEGQMSLGSKDRLETNGRTDMTDCIIVHDNVVTGFIMCRKMQHTVW